MTAWLPLQQYAPEMTGAFLELEKLSRPPGQEATFPQISAEQARRNDYEKQRQQALDRNQPDESIINDAINQGDFDAARKLIAQLANEELKIKLLEIVNLQEAVTLAQKGESTEADRLAQRLNKATSILQAYPLILDKCVESKNESYAAALLQQAIQQLKRANAELSQPSADIPALSVATDREVDPTLLSLSKLAKSVSPINESLALSVLDEIVLAANHSKIDTGYGHIGFDVSVFRKLAVNNEARVRQAAGNFQDPLRQIIALSALSQAKAEKLAREAKAATESQKKGMLSP